MADRGLKRKGHWDFADELGIEERCEGGQLLLDTSAVSIRLLAPVGWSSIWAMAGPPEGTSATGLPLAAWPDNKQPPSWKTTQPKGTKWAARQGQRPASSVLAGLFLPSTRVCPFLPRAGVAHSRPVPSSRGETFAQMTRREENSSSRPKLQSGIGSGDWPAHWPHRLHCPLIGRAKTTRNSGKQKGNTDMWWWEVGTAKGSAIQTIRRIHPYLVCLCMNDPTATGWRENCAICGHRNWRQWAEKRRRSVALEAPKIIGKIMEIGKG